MWHVSFFTRFVHFSSWPGQSITRTRQRMMSVLSHSRWAGSASCRTKPSTNAFCWACPRATARSWTGLPMETSAPLTSRTYTRRSSSGKHPTLPLFQRMKGRTGFPNSWRSFILPSTSRHRLNLRKNSPSRSRVPWRTSMRSELPPAAAAAALFALLSAKKVFRRQRMKVGRQSIFYFNL